MPFAAHVEGRMCILSSVGFTMCLFDCIVMFECCCCRADANVKSLLVENEKVLKLIRSEILQTEIRVLYELLYILNNSFRGNKTLKGLKQVMSSG